MKKLLYPLGLLALAAALSAQVVVSPPGGGRGSLVTSGAFAARPEAGVEGSVYLCTDCPYEFRDNGTTWDAFLPGVGQVTVPTMGSWTAVNSATVVSTRGVNYLEAPAATPFSIKCVVHAAPATPYTATAILQLNPNPFSSATASFAGPTFRQSSDGKLHGLNIYPSTTGATGGFYSTKWTSATGSATHYTSVSAAIPAGAATLWWTRIADNGTNRIISVSSDGVNWQVLHTVGRTDFLTADQIGMCVEAPNTTYAMGVTVLHWKEQ